MNVQSIDMQMLGLVAVAWLAIAVVIEEAFNTLFNWKHFKKFNNLGLKTPIIFGTSWALCELYKVDIFQAILASISITIETGFISCLITALLLTGGSGTVFRVFNRIREGQSKLSEGGS